MILPAAKLILQRSAAIRSAAVGGIHLLRIPQDALQPNIMLIHVGGSSGLTHRGPSGLSDARVRFYCRAQSDQSAINMARSLIVHLHGYRGIAGNLDIQLVEHINTITDFDNETNVFRQIDDFRFHYGGI